MQILLRSPPVDVMVIASPALKEPHGLHLRRRLSEAAKATRYHTCARGKMRMAIPLLPLCMMPCAAGWPRLRCASLTGLSSKRPEPRLLTLRQLGHRTSMPSRSLWQPPCCRHLATPHGSSTLPAAPSCRSRRVQLCSVGICGTDLELRT